jgi:16S rRNA (uracil1498-N3)-methyltransferase
MDKIELVAQKLTELGVGRIVFVQMKRSVLPHTMSENKLKRLDLIIKEAAEQSWRFSIPQILFEKNIDQFLSNTSMIFDTQ